MWLALFSLADSGKASSDMAERREFFDREILPLADSLYGSAVGLTKNRADADDLLQETMLKAFRAFHQFEAGSNIRAWLYRIMMNTYISSYRKKKRTPEQGDFELAKEYVQGSTAEELINERSAYIEVGNKLALEEFVDQLDERMKAAINSLQDEYREVLILNTVNDLSYKEIAKILDIPLGTVMSRLSRAKALVRDRLNEYAKN